MKIIIGTKNRGKEQALKDALAEHKAYSQCLVYSVDVDSGVSNQPLGLDEIIQGARNRAERAWAQGDYLLSVGIESGIFPVPHTKSSYMDTTACVLFDGEEFHVGLSSCFEYPKLMVDQIIREGKEVSDIALEMGFAADLSFREDQGMVGVLTKGVVSRIEYSTQAIQMALIHLLNPDHY